MNNLTINCQLSTVNSNQRIALMSCCAPCSAGAIKELAAGGRDFIVLFYNPNIFPRAEYDRRLDEQIKLCEKLGVKFAFTNYDHEKWLAAVKGHEQAPEHGSRCELCFRMRLAYGAKWAKQNGYDKITSVFGVSAHKDNNQVLRAANDAAKNEYVNIDFPYAPEPDSYRQKYCGCEFSETYR